MKKFTACMILAAATLIGASDFEAGKNAYQKSDYKKAKELFEAACHNQNNAQACAVLAVMYVNAQGVPKDNNKAKELYKKACDNNFELGCDGYKELSTR